MSKDPSTILEKTIQSLDDGEGWINCGTRCRWELWLVSDSTCAPEKATVLMCGTGPSPYRETDTVFVGEKPTVVIRVSHHVEDKESITRAFVCDTASFGFRRRYENDLATWKNTVDALEKGAKP